MEDRKLIKTVFRVFMNVKRKKHLTVFFFLTTISIFFESSLYAYQNYPFKHYNINNGLSQNTVRCILQDNQGFMWFGTKDGLNRFDGTSFKIFRSRPNGELKDYSFRRILQDKENRIWTGTDDGVYIYNPYDETFSRFTAKTEDQVPVEGVISDMVIDEDNDIWISVEEKGVFFYDSQNGELMLYEIEGIDKERKMMRLCKGENNVIWVFPYSRPFVSINKKTKRVEEFSLSGGNEILYETGEINAILPDGQGQLFVGTSSRGLLYVNTVNRTYKTLLDKDEEGLPLHVRAVIRVDNRTLWIGTESGIYIYDMVTGTYTNIRHHNNIPYSLSDNAVYTLFKDKNEGIWVGTYFGGIDYLPVRGTNFETYFPIENVNSIGGNRVREFCTAPDENIWIGTEDNGLYLFDPVNNIFLPIDEPLQTLYTNIHALYNDDDFLWIGTFSKGLYKYNLKTKTLQNYTKTNDPNSLSENSVFSIYKDSRDTLWVGTLSGVSTYRQEKNDFVRVPELKGVFVQDINEDSDGNIWVTAFSKGLFRYNSLSKDWTNFTKIEGDSLSLPYNKTTTVFEDSKRRLWVTTEGGGFSLFDKKSETFTTINTSNGLPNDVVYQIKEDNEGNLWLSTNSGLVCFDPEKKTFKNYTVYNGLRTNQFNYKSSLKTPEGTIYFGSIDGFVRFNPSYFKELQHEIPVVLTELYINNYLVSPAGKKSPLEQSILYTDRLTLSHRDNSFNLHYAVLNYSNPNTSQLFYKLEGFDKEWINGESEQKITYSNLKPGKYTLLMKLNGQLEDQQTDIVQTLAIRILPPFWLSRWAYFMYVVLIILGIMGLVHYLNLRNRKIQRRKMYIFEQEKERELYRSKINFFTNVAHEIRTPLSLIKAPLDHVVMTETVSETMKENLQIMSKNTERLLNLTNQLLDFRKTESDAYRLNLETRNVSNLIRDTFTRFTPLAKQRNVIFELDLPDTAITACLDKEAFLKIISNLVNNAIKYCDSFVRLKACTLSNEENEMVYFITENDGEMIPENQREEIFKPFRQLNGEQSRRVTGTGIGLALSRSLAELHKGSLVLEDNNDFIRFRLALPVGNVENAISESLQEPEKAKKDKLVEKTAYSTILLVDDDMELLRFEEKLFSPHYHVLTAGDGEQALKILQTESVHLIVCDVMMPIMDGFEFTKRVKSDIEFSHIPVILLTAKANVESKVEGFEVGADAYIEKPFSLEVLMAQIANLLQNREQLRETYLKHPFIGANSMSLNKSDEEFIKKLHSIVHENIGDTTFVIEDISEQFNMSRASFYRKIKGVLNLTPSEYIRIERLKRAALLLKEENYKINEICYMVGFNSPSYFSKCFHQQFGILPKDFV